MKKNIFKYIGYFLLFIYFFLCINFLFANDFNCDQLYQFGFSYSLVRGEIPYLNFNMIVTPFSTFVYAIPLIFKNSYLLFTIFQAFLITCLFIFLFSKYEKKAFIILALFPLFYPLQFTKVFFAGYSFLLIFEFFVLLYLEDKKDKGYITGIALSIVLLTKQSVGIPLLGILIYYFIVNKSKLKNILKTYFIIPIIFLIYLLITKSLYPFIDQCFLGLFDFASNNSFITIWTILFIIISIIVIYRFIITKDIKYLYLFLYSGVTLPAFDQYHFAIYVLLFIFILIKDMDIKLSNRYLIIVSSFIMIMSLLICYALYYHFNIKSYIHSYNNYELLVKPNNEYQRDIKTNKIINKYKNKRLIIFSDDSYLFKIINNLDIEYYDLINRGNNGYDGANKIINKLEKEKNAYIIIDVNNDIGYSQIDLRIIKHVKDNYKLIYDKDSLKIYYKE